MKRFSFAITLTFSGLFHRILAFNPIINLPLQNLYKIYIKFIWISNFDACTVIDYSSCFFLCFFPSVHVCLLAARCSRPGMCVRACDVYATCAIFLHGRRGNNNCDNRPPATDRPHCLWRLPWACSVSFSYLARLAAVCVCHRSPTSDQRDSICLSAAHNKEQIVLIQRVHKYIHIPRPLPSLTDISICCAVCLGASLQVSYCNAN